MSRSDFKQHLLAAEMRHELEMRQKGYLVGKNGKSYWAKNGRPYRQEPEWKQVAEHLVVLAGLGLVIVMLLLV